MDWGFFGFCCLMRANAGILRVAGVFCKRGCVCEALTSSWEPRVPVFAIRQHFVTPSNRIWWEPQSDCKGLGYLLSVVGAW